MPRIEARDVTKSYGDVTALSGVSLAVEAGEALGVVGTNGAGKTTLFRLLTGHETPDSGTVRVAGLDPTDGTAVRERVGYLPEDAGFQPALTGREVLAFHARMRGVPADRRERRVETVLGVVGLEDAADRRVEGYSNGMGRRLGLGTALVGDPDVLLLDEPTAGLDPGGVAAFNRVVRRVRAERDVTVVLTTHVLDEVERLCDRVAVVEDGRLRTVGPVGEVRAAGGDEVTVSLAFEGEVPESVGYLRDAYPGLTVTVEETTARLTCPRERVRDLLTDLTAVEFASIEVSEPDLQAAFHETVADPEPAAVEGGETA